MTLFEYEALVEKPDDCQSGLEEAQAAVPNEQIDKLKYLQLNFVFLSVEVLGAVCSSLRLFVKTGVKYLPLYGVKQP